MERAGKRATLDHEALVLVGDRTDAGRDQAGALGHARRARGRARGRSATPLRNEGVATTGVAVGTDWLRRY